MKLNKRGLGKPIPTALLLPTLAGAVGHLTKLMKVIEENHYDRI